MQTYHNISLTPPKTLTIKRLEDSPLTPKPPKTTEQQPQTKNLSTQNPTPTDQKMAQNNGICPRGIFTRSDELLGSA